MAVSFSYLTEDKTETLSPLLHCKSQCAGGFVLLPKSLCNVYSCNETLLEMYVRYYFLYRLALFSCRNTFSGLNIPTHILTASMELSLFFLCQGQLHYLLNAVLTNEAGYAHIHITFAILSL